MITGRETGHTYVRALVAVGTQLCRMVRQDVSFKSSAGVSVGAYIKPVCTLHICMRERMMVQNRAFIRVKMALG